MISGPGRPLRFLGIVLAGWIGLRAVMLWPRPEALPVVMQPIAPARAGMPAAIAPRRAPLPSRTVAAPVTEFWRAAPVTRHFGNTARDGGSGPTAASTAPIPPRSDAPEPAPPIVAGLPRAGPPPISPGTAWTAPRLSGSFWLVARAGDGLASGPLGGQLGGSQAGLRLAYMIDRKRRIAVAARITAPLGPGLREAAIGVEWQPSRLPVRLVAEQRIAIGGGRGGPVIGLVGGFGPLPVGRGVRVESYAQAGAIHRNRTERFVDGAAHVSHPLGALGPVPVDLGAGLWGGAQRGAERLDIGPSITATLPVAGQRLRLSLDWRERVAGRARPGSGLALTLGADF